MPGWGDGEPQVLGNASWPLLMRGLRLPFFSSSFFSRATPVPCCSSTLALYPLSFPLGTQHDVSAAQGPLTTLTVGEIEDFPKDALQEKTMRPSRLHGIFGSKTTLTRSIQYPH